MQKLNRHDAEISSFQMFLVLRYTVIIWLFPFSYFSTYYNNSYVSGWINPKADCHFFLFYCKYRPFANLFHWIWHWHLRNAHIEVWVKTFKRRGQCSVNALTCWKSCTKPLWETDEEKRKRCCEILKCLKVLMKEEILLPLRQFFSLRLSVLFNVQYRSCFFVIVILTTVTIIFCTWK